MGRRILAASALVVLLLGGSRQCLASSPPRETGPARMACCKELSARGPIACPCHHHGTAALAETLPRGHLPVLGGLLPPTADETQRTALLAVAPAGVSRALDRPPRVA